MFTLLYCHQHPPGFWQQITLDLEVLAAYTSRTLIIAQCWLQGKQVVKDHYSELGVLQRIGERSELTHGRCWSLGQLVGVCHSL